MRETVIALVLFVLLSGGAVVVHSASFYDLLWVGLWLVGGGLIFSVPCALRYHLLLYRALSARDALDRRWLLSPTAHHPRLTASERQRVMPWFYAGAAGWGVSLLGCGALALVAFLA